jgi:hypothetical protein
VREGKRKRLNGICAVIDDVWLVLLKGGGTAGVRKARANGCSGSRSGSGDGVPGDQAKPASLARLGRIGVR